MQPFRLVLEILTRHVLAVNSRNRRRQYQQLLRYVIFLSTVCITAIASRSREAWDHVTSAATKSGHFRNNRSSFAATSVQGADFVDSALQEIEVVNYEADGGPAFSGNSQRGRGSFSSRKRSAASDSVRPLPSDKVVEVGGSTSGFRLAPIRIIRDFNPTLGSRLSQLADDQTVPWTSVAAVLMPEDVSAAAIRELSLGACRIRSVPPRLLSGMIRLERLALWANEIDRLPVGMFNDALQLRELLLWGNRIDRFDVWMLFQMTSSGEENGHLSTLQLLDLDRNRITTIGKQAVRNRNEDRLHGSGYDASEPWRGFPELRVLRLSFNRISSIVGGSFRGLSGLRSLTLDSNGLAFIHVDAFDGLRSLTRLSLSDNAVVFVPDGLFSRLDQLVELRLARNRIEHVWAPTFEGLRSLHRLDLSGNRLSQLPDDTFRRSAPSLSWLRLDDNRLRTLRRCVFPSQEPPSSSGANLFSHADEIRNDRTASASFSSDLHSNEPFVLLPFADSAADEPRRGLSLIGNDGLLCDCRLSWLSKVVGDRSLRTIWGSCDVQLTSLQHLTPSSPSAASSASSKSSTLPSTSWLASMAVPHHHGSSASGPSILRSPIQTVVVRGLFDNCAPISSADCRT